MQDRGCEKTDRYISFQGIDCDGNARRVMACIERHLAIPERNDVFWRYFAKKREADPASRADDLFLIHAHINQVRELFETWGDGEALKLLEQLEDECC